MPTHSEIEEICNNCNWESTTLNGVNGFKVTSKNPDYSDNSLFIPAGGYISNGGPYYQGKWGEYWSSTLLTYTYNYKLINIDAARILNFFDGQVFPQNGLSRNCGAPIRPVCSK